MENGENSLKALILVGGFGTRLRPLSCTRPKALFPIVNKPLLQWTFERLAKNGTEEVILAVSYQTEVFMKQHKIPKCGLKITYSRDPLHKPLGTGGPIKKAEKLVGDGSPFLALNGDIFADVNYQEILKMHEEKDVTATIALHSVKDPSRYGVAELSKGNRIKRFIEKPPRETAPTNLINAGVYVFSPKIFKYIPKNRTVSIEREVFPRLAKEGELDGYIFDGLWMDIGKPQEYLDINKTLLKSHATSQIYKKEKKGKFEDPVALDKKVSIGEKSVIGPYAILGQNVTVGNNVRIRESVIFPNVTMSDYASINGAIIGEGAVIGKKTKIGAGCILGDRVKIKDNVTLAKGVTVCPAKEVTKSVLKPRYIV